ncbi:hypothetical protein D0809_23590 [Flavobacterium circumlabens]|uniref:Uncharacterized protein n=1 Tax=Flavobacterium circumlabens TaxID=2133765 RepID=A0A4Y7U6A3_9FLAO|nr:hypothetical protein [Flavobacterium circumlabens]TCN50529.1 hypothetical protein EV142_1156 [Flavobacterium circumlabens]TEB41781.1 hypothetical protein D0809_23590 [Flavobacterium circumlabens]
MEYFNLVAIPTNDLEHFILHKYGSINRIATFIDEVTSVRDQLSNLFGTPELETNQIGDYFYGASWITQETIVIVLEYADKNLTLQIRQGQKITI